MISSSSNVQIKNLIKLQKNARTRKEQNAFVIEGKKLFQEARTDGTVLHAYVTEEYLEEIGLSAEAYFQGIPYEVVDPKVLKEAADTKTPQGILAIVEKPSYQLEDLWHKNTCKFIVLEDLRDPGNLGTIMRTAEGAGMDGVIMSRETVDLFNPKVVRSTMGSIFRVPFVYVDDLQQTIEQMKQHQFAIVATDLQGKNDYSAESYPAKTAVVIGNEAKGITEQMRQAATLLVKIPMQGKLESLNASIAAGLMMYELGRTH